MENDIDPLRFDLSTDRIIDSYDNKEKKFNIGNKYMTIEENDIWLILGILSGDTKLKLKYAPKCHSEFVLWCFGIGIKKINPKAISDALDHALNIEGQDSIEDVARLLILYLCITFLFATKGNRLKWGFLYYVEDINAMITYNWSAAIINDIMSTIEDKNVSGCVVALQVKTMTISNKLSNI